MNNIFPTPNNNEIFLYVSKEMKNNIPLDENEFGIGETKHPITRYKEHNNTGSKITVKINFIAVYLMPKYINEIKSETYIHNKLIALGYKRNTDKKEMFYSTEENKIPLSLQIIQKEMEQYSLNGPWEINNKQIIKIQSIKQHEETKYTLPIQNQNDTKECIQYLEQKCKHDFKLLRNKFNQLHNTYKKHLDIQLWAYNNNIISYHALNKKLKTHYKIILLELQKDNLNTLDILNFEEIYDYENQITKEQCKEIINQYITQMKKQQSIRFYTTYKNIYQCL